MEMNTRLQVEHPVTEAITGQDLVEWQLRIAAGEPLPRRQEELRIEGWAMEARLYAENPTTGFLPSTGPLRHLRLPTELRVDSGVAEGGEITGFYDPLMAKLITHAPNRAAAARRLAVACAAVEVWPVRTNAAFLARVARDPAFIAGDIDTGFIERRASTLVPAPEPGAHIVHAAARALLPHGADPWQSLVGFRSAAPADLRVTVAIEGQPHRADLARAADPAPVGDRGVPAGAPAAATTVAPSVAWVDGGQVLFSEGEAWRIGLPSSQRGADPGGIADGALRSPMPGRIVSVAVRLGDPVVKGQRLLALEAMKMEHALLAPFDGTVTDLAVSEGEQVAENLTLIRIAR